MIPVQNTIRAKKIKIQEMEVHYTTEGGTYKIHQHLFDPPIQLNSGDTTTIAWTLHIGE